MIIIIPSFLASNCFGIILASPPICYNTSFCQGLLTRIQYVERAYDSNYQFSSTLKCLFSMQKITDEGSIHPMPV